MDCFMRGRQEFSGWGWPAGDSWIADGCPSSEDDVLADILPCFGATFRIVRFAAHRRMLPDTVDPLGNRIEVAT
jgi:hypothetical protein